MYPSMAGTDMVPSTQCPVHDALCTMPSSFRTRARGGRCILVARSNRARIGDRCVCVCVCVGIGDTQQSAI